MPVHGEPAARSRDQGRGHRCARLHRRPTRRPVPAAFASRSTIRPRRSGWARRSRDLPPAASGPAASRLGPARARTARPWSGSSIPRAARSTLREVEARRTNDGGVRVSAGIDSRRARRDRRRQQPRRRPEGRISERKLRREVVQSFRLGARAPLARLVLHDRLRRRRHVLLSQPRARGRSGLHHQDHGDPGAVARRLGRGDDAARSPTGSRRSSRSSTSLDYTRSHHDAGPDRRSSST